ncbi:BC1872 family protein [Thermaerobacillus caldiproteolyticus]|uniref:BC1872 family protein n=1 Tax=Thermaerobacillus caldiproteolyticus TaxID=247480 RepID=UPI0018F23BA4|nr:hypothetical protein [Anoxybacillus caldiproteolyticus]
MNLREIDRLVAEHVMGWEPVYDDGDLISFVTEFGILFFSDDDEREWSPTIDIADAWQVVEKLIDEGYDINVYNHNKEFNVEINIEEDDKHLWFYGEADSAPLAICLAALKAVGVNIE